MSAHRYGELASIANLRCDRKMTQYIGVNSVLGSSEIERLLVNGNCVAVCP